MSKTVFSKEEADRLAVTYNPKKFPHTISRVATEFVAFQAHQTDTAGKPSFRIDRLVAEQNGVAELERMSIEEKVEQEALARLKDVQEEAYQQAYGVGLEEGRESSFNESKAQFAERIESFDRLLSEIENLKNELISYNEAHIVHLAYYLARRIAVNEIEQRPEFILKVINEAIQSAQEEEDITVRLAKSDIEFIESVRPKLGKEFDTLKKIKLEASDDIKAGGCVVRTNYGEVDATIQQRIDKLWDALQEKIPKTKDEAGTAEGQP